MITYPWKRSGVSQWWIIDLNWNCIWKNEILVDMGSWACNHKTLDPGDAKGEKQLLKEPYQSCFGWPALRFSSWQQYLVNRLWGLDPVDSDMLNQLLWLHFTLYSALHSIGWITFCRYTKSSCSSLEPSYEELTFVDLDLGPDYLREEFSSNDGQDEDTVEFIQPPKRLTTRNPPFQVSCLHFRYLKILFCILFS